MLQSIKHIPQQYIHIKFLNRYARLEVLMRRTTRRMRRHTRSRCRVSSMTMMKCPGLMTKGAGKGRKRKGGEEDQDRQGQDPVQDPPGQDLGQGQGLVEGGGGQTMKTLMRMTWTSSKRILG